MDAGDAAAVVVAVASAIAVAVLVAATVALTKAVGELRRTAEELRAEALPVVAELRRTVAAADAELERVDSLIGTAENVTATTNDRAITNFFIRIPPIKTGKKLDPGLTRA